MSDLPKHISLYLNHNDIEHVNLRLDCGDICEISARY